MSPRPLLHKRVNLSITGSDSLAAGYAPAQVTRIILQFVSALAGQGAGVAFGHDWRDDGVMEAVHGFVRQAAGPMPVHKDERRQALLVNLLPWPDRPALPEEERKRLGDILEVAEAGLPAGLMDFDKFRHGGPEKETLYLRARGLTHLRHRLGKISDARVCLGGPERALGRYPGIVEEAYLAVTDQVPLYLSGLLGGVAKQLVEAVNHRPMPKDFGLKARAGELYAHPPLPEAGPGNEDVTFDPERVWERFVKLGAKGLCELNRLTWEENDELMHTRSVERAVALVLAGVSRLPVKKVIPMPPG